MIGLIIELCCNEECRHLAPFSRESIIDGAFWRHELGIEGAD